MHIDNCSHEALNDVIIHIDENSVSTLHVPENTAERSSLTERTYLLALSATIGTALAGSDSLRTILQRCAEATVEHLGVTAAAIWTQKPEEHVLELQATAGIYTPLSGLYDFIQVGQGEIGLVAQECQPYVTNAIAHDQRLQDKAWAQRVGVVAFAAYPLIVENRLVGVMAMFARRPFATATLRTLFWVAGVMAMGIDRLYIADALARSLVNVVHTNKSLRRKHTELDEFAYIASHDLQEPLRKLTTFSSMLQQDLGPAIPARAAKDLEFILDATTRMQTLLENILELSRLNTTTMHWERVDLLCPLKRALSAMSVPIQSTNATITHDPLPTVWGDQALLTQLYQSLLSNALKFCTETSPAIHLTAMLQEQQVVLGIQDNGIGIKPEYHEHIFRPFKRLHGRGEYAGNGIGLAICRKIVERHGGHIWVESDSGEGAHFKFTLLHHTAPPPLLPETDNS
jgi:signal transduction histidine kinase